MAISQYLKVIGRGKDGARALNREQAADLFGQVLDGAVTDLEVGAFCLAMRIKGETPAEMAGFLDAVEARLHKLPATDRPTVVLPSYNGARKLPLLTPLLALLLAREGLPVLVHGTATEDARVHASKVLETLGVKEQSAINKLAPGEVAFVPTRLLCAGLQRLLDVRRAVGLRNPAHSLVKLMNPCAGPSLIVGSYTHAEYASSMAAVFELVQAHALLLRGTEGEPVADARRMPRMTGFVAGRQVALEDAPSGPLVAPPELPTTVDAPATAAYIQSVMAGRINVPAPIARQVEHILHLVSSS